MTAFGINPRHLRHIKTQLAVLLQRLPDGLERRLVFADQIALEQQTPGSGFLGLGRRLRAISPHRGRLFKNPDKLVFQLFKFRRLPVQLVEIEQHHPQALAGGVVMDLGRLFQYCASGNVLPVSKQNRRFFCLCVYRIDLFLDMKAGIELAELKTAEIERRIINLGFLRRWCRTWLDRRGRCGSRTDFGSRQDRRIGRHFSRTRNGRRARHHLLWLFFEKRENHDLGKCSDHH